MAAGLSSRTADSPSRPPGPSSQSPRVVQPTMDRLKILYPHVNEEETPLPRSWSPKDKYNFIGLSQNNLRVHYKGESLSFTYLETKKLTITSLGEPSSIVLTICLGLGYYDCLSLSSNLDFLVLMDVTKQDLSLGQLA